MFRGGKGAPTTTEKPRGEHPPEVPQHRARGSGWAPGPRPSSATSQAWGPLASEPSLLRLPHGAVSSSPESLSARPTAGIQSRGHHILGRQPPVGMGTRAEICTRDCPGGHPSWREGRSGAPPRGSHGQILKRSIRSDPVWRRRKTFYIKSTVKSCAKSLHLCWIL